MPVVVAMPVTTKTVLLIPSTAFCNGDLSISYQLRSSALPGNLPFPMQTAVTAVMTSIPIV